MNTELMAHLSLPIFAVFYDWSKNKIVLNNIQMQAQEEL